MQDDAPRPVSIERATQRVREAAWVACLPLFFTLFWWALMGWLISNQSPAAESQWEAELTLWATDHLATPIPFALAVTLILLGPVCSLIGGVLVLYWLRRAPEQLARVLPIVAALCAVALLSSAWVNLEHVWEETYPEGGRGSGKNSFSPGPCCGVWHLLLSAWLLWATVRYGPVFRAMAPDPQR